MKGKARVMSFPFKSFHCWWDLFLSPKYEGIHPSISLRSNSFPTHLVSKWRKIHPSTSFTFLSLRFLQSKQALKVARRNASWALLVDVALQFSPFWSIPYPKKECLVYSSLISPSQFPFPNTMLMTITSKDFCNSHPWVEFRQQN